jgi:hypothetical protein
LFQFALLTQPLSLRFNPVAGPWGGVAGRLVT